MKWKAFKSYMFVILSACAIVFILHTEAPSHTFDLAKDYKENSRIETGALNAATGIYLDYRVYDSLFESLLLLVSAVGIHYLNKEEKNERSKL
jgi:multicomponent Na+:H+ antiporter subunit B